jgi:hypothetical protein
MTEGDWLAGSDPSPMLTWLNERDASARKFRLFTCAAARSLWHLMTWELARETVIAAERFADAELTDAQRRACAEALRATYPPRMTPDNPVSAEYLTGMIAFYCAWSNSVTPMAGLHLNRHGSETVVRWGPFARVLAATGLWDHATGHPIAVAEVSHQCRMVRDIFGNPFRPVAVDPAWLTATVLALAQGICADRAFDRLPILADALEDAGCDNEQLLEHCRGSGPHVRGCWAVDLILSKE